MNLPIEEVVGEIGGVFCLSSGGGGSTRLRIALWDVRERERDGIT